MRRVICTMLLAVLLAWLPGAANGQLGAGGTCYYAAEGNFSNDHGYIHYIDAAGALHEDVLDNPSNAGKTLGVTLQYATFYNGKIYAVSKQKFGSDDNRLVRIDPSNWKIEEMGKAGFSDMDAELRTFHFLGVSETHGFLSTSDAKLYRVNLEDLSVAQVSGNGWPTLVNREVGSMVLYRGRIVVEVFGSKQGYSTDVLRHELWVLDPANGARKSKFNAQGLFNPVVTKDGRLLALHVQGTEAERKYSLVQLDINDPSAEPMPLLTFAGSIRPADFQTQVWSWSQGYVFASARENSLYWNVESGMWDMRSIAMLNLDEQPLTPRVVYTGSDKFYGISRENPHDGSLWVNFNGDYGPNDKIKRLAKGSDGMYSVDGSYTITGSYNFSSCPFFEDLHAAVAKDSQSIAVYPGAKVDLCDYVEDADGFSASVLFTHASVTGEGWSVSMANMHTLSVESCGRAPAELTVEAWSAGRKSVVTKKLSLAVIPRTNVAAMQERAKTRGGGEPYRYRELVWPGRTLDVPQLQFHVFTLKDVQQDSKRRITSASIDRKLEVGDEFDPNKGLYVRIDLEGGYAVDCASETTIDDWRGIAHVQTTMDRKTLEENFSSQNREADVRVFAEYFFLGEEDPDEWEEPGYMINLGDLVISKKDYIEKTDAEITLSPIDAQYEGYMWAMHSEFIKDSWGRPTKRRWMMLSGAHFRPLKQNKFIATVEDTKGLKEYVVTEYKVDGDLHSPAETGSEVKFQPKGNVTLSVSLRAAAGGSKLKVTIPPSQLEPKERGVFTVADASGQVMVPGEYELEEGAVLQYKITGASFPYENSFEGAEAWKELLQVQSDVAVVAPPLYAWCKICFVSEGGFHDKKVRYNENFEVSKDNPKASDWPKVIAKGADPVSVDSHGYGTYVARAENISINATWDAWGKLKVSATQGGEVKVLRGAEELKDGADITQGCELIITAMPAQGYSLKSLTVNGGAFTSGKTFTVGEGDVVVVADFEKVGDQETAVESALLSGVSAAPNPFDGRLTLRGARAVESWGVYTLHGQLVAQGVGDGCETIEIATLSWAQGVYVVRLRAADGARAISVVKQ